MSGKISQRYKPVMNLRIAIGNKARNPKVIRGVYIEYRKF